MLVGMSQEKIGQACGITLQQVSQVRSSSFYEGARADQGSAGSFGQQPVSAASRLCSTQVVGGYRASSIGFWVRCKYRPKASRSTGIKPLRGRPDRVFRTNAERNCG